MQLMSFSSGVADEISRSNFDEDLIPDISGLSNDYPIEEKESVRVMSEDTELRPVSASDEQEGYLKSPPGVMQKDRVLRGPNSILAEGMRKLVADAVDGWYPMNHYKSQNSARVTASNLKKHTRGMPNGRFATAVGPESETEEIWVLYMKYLGPYTSTKFEKY